MDVKRWLNEEEAAEILDITPATLRRWLAAGRIAYYRMGRFVRIRREDVEAFIEGSRIEAAV